MANKRKCSTLLLDFDGTLTKVDLLDYLAESRGKGSESRQLRNKYLRGEISGKVCLFERIRLLRGLHLSEIHQLLSFDFIRPPLHYFSKWVKANGIRVILISGNICPVLQYYKEILGASKVFCTKLIIEDNKIVDISPNGIEKDLNVVKTYLNDIDVCADNTVAIGDDISDIPFFDFAGSSIAFNGQENVILHASKSAKGDLKHLVEVLDSVIHY